MKLMQRASIKLQFLEDILIYILSIFHTNTQYTQTHFPSDEIQSHLPSLVQECLQMAYAYIYCMQHLQVDVFKLKELLLVTQ
jgi:hypothetical protein